MLNSLPYLIFLAVRTVAAAHRMIAEGWEMFEEAVEAAGTGDLPQLHRSLRVMTTPTPPPPPSPTPPPAGPVEPQATTGVPMEVAGVSGVSLVKIEGASSEPVFVVGGVRKWACPQCSTVRGSKNGCHAHIRQAHTGKVLLCGLCGFSTYNLDSLSRHEKEHN